MLGTLRGQRVEYIGIRILRVAWNLYPRVNRNLSFITLSTSHLR